MKKWTIPIIMVMIMLFTCYGFSENVLKTIAVGDVVLFGSYEQDNNLDNGPEPVEWIVLEVQNEKALLLSKYGLDVKLFHSEYIDVKWFDCDLRAWLNNEFKEDAFTSAEQSAILMTSLDNSNKDGFNRKFYECVPSPDTEDHVFLLNSLEYEKYCPAVIDGRCIPTEYALAHGAFVSPNPDLFIEGKAPCFWWLRSIPTGAEYEQYHAELVWVDGEDVVNLPVIEPDIAVRPAIWLELRFLNDDTAEQQVPFVHSVHWIRTIQIEEYRESQETGWELPEGAELISQSEEISHYENVLDHYEYVEVPRIRQVLDHYETEYVFVDNGNGTFEQRAVERPVYIEETYIEMMQQPVYIQVPRNATKYQYIIHEWKPSRSVSASGETHDIYWPEVSLGENEREGAKDELCAVTVTDASGANVLYLLDESAWMNISVGDVVNPVVMYDNMVVIYNDRGEKIASAVMMKQ